MSEKIIQGYVKHLEGSLHTINKLIKCTEKLLVSTRRFAIANFFILRLDLWFDYFKYKRELKLQYEKKSWIELELKAFKERKGTL